MPALNLPNLNFNIDSGTDKQTLEQIVDSLSKYRKELNFLLMNLDTDNMPFIESKLTDIDGNFSSIIQTVDDVTLNFSNLKTLTGGQQINNGVTTISPTGIKVQHTNFPGQYSEMRADGFIRQWAYGQAKYLNDIWVSTITSTDGNSYITEPPATRIYLPQSFRGRQLTTEVFLTVSGLNNTQLGSKYDITSTGVRLAWYGTWLDIEINIVGQNWDVASPYIDIKAFTYVNGPVIPSYSNPTGGNFTENYRKISFTVMLVGR